VRLPRIVAALAAIPALALAQPRSDLPPVQISIEAAMRAVNRTSHPLAASRATSERAAADVVVARSGFFPQINLIGSYVRTLKSEYDGLFPTGDSSGLLGDLSKLPFGRKHTWNAGINATQMIWDGGLTSSTVEVARGSKHVADLDVLVRRAHAVLDVTEAYFAAVLAARLVAIGEASLALAEGTLEQSRLGLEQGTKPEFDVVRSEVTRDNQRTALIRSRADRDQAFRRLRQLLGLPLDTPVVLTTGLSVDDPTGAGHLDGFARGAAGVPPRVERLVVAQARTNVEIRRAQRRVARAARWPTLNVSTDYGRVAYPNHLWPDVDWRTNFTVGVYLDFRLFTGFRTTAEIRGARADQRVAEEQLAEVAVQSELDQRRTVSDADVASATLTASHRSTALARKAYEIADVRYREGLSTYLELVDARIALDQAQINEATAARDVAVSRVRLALLPSLVVPETGAVVQSTPQDEAVVASPVVAVPR
jgi:outer membrane protein